MRKHKRPKQIVKISCTVKTKKGEIPYVLSRSTGRRNLTITIDEKASVAVASPFRMKEIEIHRFIHEKADWIVKKLEEARRFKNILDQKDFSHGQVFLFLGKRHKLNIVTEDIKRCRITFDLQNGWSVSVPEGLAQQKQRELVKAKMVQWYRAQAKEVLGGRIFHYARIMGVEPKSITVRSQKRLWGCCDYDTQSISLNWQIVLSPVDVVDYVVVHELCHLTIPNHSKRFWKRVEKFMPDYQARKKWLLVNNADMILP